MIMIVVVKMVRRMMAILQMVLKINGIEYYGNNDNCRYSAICVDDYYDFDSC